MQSSNVSSLVKDLGLGKDFRVPGIVGRSYTIFLEGDLRDVDDFEVVLKGVCREYNARLFERRLNKLQ
jgi:hypothetical protein